MEIKKQQFITKAHKAVGFKPAWLKAALLTLLCFFVVAASLFAPAALMVWRDANIFNSVYALELHGGSIYNPEQANQIALITASTNLEATQYLSENYEEDIARIRQAMQLGYESGVVPGYVLETFNYHASLPQAELFSGTEEKNSFEFFSATLQSQEQDNYFYFHIIIHENCLYSLQCDGGNYYQNYLENITGIPANAYESESYLSQTSTTVKEEAHQQVLTILDNFIKSTNMQTISDWYYIDDYQIDADYYYISANSATAVLTAQLYLNDYGFGVYYY